jgi:hypothetical protein
MITQPHSDAVAVTNWRFPFWGVLTVVLICPLVAMRFTNEVRWDLADFIAAAALLTSFGIAVEAAFFLLRKSSTRAVIIGAALTTVSLIWAHAAVGIF